MGTFKVIVIDRKPESGERIVAALQGTGCTVTPFADWRAAVAKSAASPPDIVIAEYCFEDGISAADVVEAIRFFSPAVKGIALWPEGAEDPRAQESCPSVRAWLPITVDAELLQSTFRRVRAEIDLPLPETAVGVLWTTPSGRVQGANPFASRFFCLDVQTLTSADLRDLLSVAGYSAEDVPSLLSSISGNTPPRESSRSGVGFYVRVPLPAPAGGHLWMFGRPEATPTRDSALLKMVLTACEPGHSAGRQVAGSAGH